MDNKKRYILGVVVAVIGLIGFLVFGQDEVNYDNDTDYTDYVTETSITTTEENAEESQVELIQETQEPQKDYSFRNRNRLEEHYEKHGKEMGFASPEDYEAAASAVVNNPSALHKIEAEDGDDVYYVEATNEFVIVSTDGYLRTYFLPNGGIDYYNRQ